jgi:hypothetical protein
MNQNQNFIGMSRIYRTLHWLQSRGALCSLRAATPIIGARYVVSCRYRPPRGLPGLAGPAAHPSFTCLRGRRRPHTLTHYVSHVARPPAAAAGAARAATGADGSERGLSAPGACGNGRPSSHRGTLGHRAGGRGRRRGRINMSRQWSDGAKRMTWRLKLLCVIRCGSGTATRRRLLTGRLVGRMSETGPHRRRSTDH